MRISNNLTIDEDLELERQLSFSTSQPSRPYIVVYYYYLIIIITLILIIIITYGDIYDCVDIYKLPAYDHPSLEDHKLQVISSSSSSCGKLEYLIQWKCNKRIEKKIHNLFGSLFKTLHTMLYRDTLIDITKASELHPK